MPSAVTVALLVYAVLTVTGVTLLVVLYLLERDGAHVRAAWLHWLKLDRYGAHGTT